MLALPWKSRSYAIINLLLPSFYSKAKARVPRCHHGEKTYKIRNLTKESSLTRWIFFISPKEIGKPGYFNFLSNKVFLNPVTKTQCWDSSPQSRPRLQAAAKPATLSLLRVLELSTKENVLSLHQPAIHLCSHHIPKVWNCKPTRAQGSPVSAPLSKDISWVLPFELSATLHPRRG